MHPTQLFIGEIRPLPQSGRPTGMYKQAVTATVDITELGFSGDRQADLRVHGGPEKPYTFTRQRIIRALPPPFPTPHRCCRQAAWAKTFRSRR